MNKIKIFIPLLLISCFAVFTGVARARFTDVVSGQVVTVSHVGFVGGVHQFNVTNEQGASVTVPGSINENGRGVPNLGGITSGFFAGQTIQPPSVRHTTPLDSSPRHDAHFSNYVAQGHSLVGYTTNPANTLAPGAEVSLQEAIAIANRLAGNPMSWREAGIMADRYYRMRGDQRGLSIDLINQILADAGSSVRVDGNTRGDFFRRAIAAGGEGNIINRDNGGVIDGAVDDFQQFLYRHIPLSPTCSYFTSDRSRIPIRSYTILRWSCRNIDSCSINPGFPDNIGSFGNRKVSPQATTTYTLTCHGGGQSVYRTKTIKVIAVDDIREIPAFYDGFMRLVGRIGDILR